MQFRTISCGIINVMSEKTDSSVKLFSYSDDQPVDGKGLLIPTPGDLRIKSTYKPYSIRHISSITYTRAAFSVFGLLALVLLGTSGYGLVYRSNLVASPIVTVVDPNSQNTTTMEYGPQEALSKNTFFIETRDAFVDEGLTFIEVDISSKQLRFFQNGVLLQSAEILSTGEAGSLWDTPSGLYQIKSKEEILFTSTGQVYLPWLITFQGNYRIHGWPAYPNKTPVGADFNGGGIRLDDSSAEALFEYAKKGLPVLVHLDIKKKRDTFVYEPQVPELDTKHYFIADIENGTILAASDLDKIAPIASLTKLMTAIIASEELSLDSQVRAASPSFVTSLVPRLADRSSVSMYSLIQLLLVESSNEAAETIAGELGREQFIEAMNAKARQLGMMDTSFADPSGLSAENVSSVADLYILTKYIYNDKKFIFDITANETLSTVYVGGEFDGLINFNEVEDMENFVGGKVGETNAAGQTSVSLHKLKFQGVERTLAIILLGSEGRREDINTLISYAQNRFDH